MRILSFDLGDFNTLSAWHYLNDDTGEVQRGEVVTSSAALEQILLRQRPDQVLCEACTMTYVLSEVVEQCCPESAFLAANTNAEAWRWKCTKRKTDASDAERLVRLFRLGELEAVFIPDRQMRTLRRLLNHRSKLIGKRTACYNAIRHACKQREVALPAGERLWTQAGLALLRDLCAPLDQKDLVLMDDSDAWLLELRQLLDLVELLNAQLHVIERSLNQHDQHQAQTQRLQTAPGIGRITSLLILAYLGDAHRFQRGRQVAAYAGLVPRVFQSGQQCRHGGITKAGNRVLRSTLINAAWQAVKHSDWAQEIFDRVCGNSPSRRKIAIVAVARHLLIRCWAMMRDEQSWLQPNQALPPPKPSAQAA